MSSNSRQLSKPVPQRFINVTASNRLTLARRPDRTAVCTIRPPRNLRRRLAYASGRKTGRLSGTVGSVLRPLSQHPRQPTPTMIVFHGPKGGGRRRLGHRFQNATDFLFELAASRRQQYGCTISHSADSDDTGRVFRPEAGHPWRRSHGSIS